MYPRFSQPNPTFFKKFSQITNHKSIIERQSKMKRGREEDQEKEQEAHAGKRAYIDLGVNESKESEDNLLSDQDYRKLVKEEWKVSSSARVKCPYLDSVNRQMLDFDSEKLCSQTLTNRNVYVCLVCGKFYEGRGKSTPAYTHALQMNHYVYMNMESGRSYCLPDGYEVLDISLKDIQRCLSPTYSLQDITLLDRNDRLSRDVHGVSYLPGFVGLNNLNATDDLNVLVHLVSHIAPIRDFLLQHALYQFTPNKLIREFGLVLRKIWSSGNFKSTVSPQELAQIISIESKRRFSIGKRAEVLEMFVWLLNHFNQALDKKVAKPIASEPSVIFEPIQGIIEVTTRTKLLVDNYAEQQLLEKGKDSSTLHEAKASKDGWVEKTIEVPFNYLSLDIPPCPLFRDSHGSFVIPQVTLFQLLSKFDGHTWYDTITKEAHVRKQYRIKKLPRYLVLHLVRFTKNNFSLEKNPTIVTFPVRNLEMSEYLFATGEDGEEVKNKHYEDAVKQVKACPSMDDIATYSTLQLKKVIEKFGSALHINELQAATSVAPVDEEVLKQNLLTIATRVVERVELLTSTKYDLVSNVCHDTESAGNGIEIGDINFADLLMHKKKPLSQFATNAMMAGVTATGAIAGGGAAPVAADDVVHKGSYKIHVPLKSNGQWYEIQDLHVQETSPQLIGKFFPCFFSSFC